jgi:hypothetical protein
MNCSGHVRGRPAGGNIALADGSARWLNFPQDYYGPAWDTYLPKPALIPKDDNEYSWDGNLSAARYFWANADRTSGQALRGRIQSCP